MAYNENDMNYREIITKAVCGKGEKFTEEIHTISPSHKPSSILGCWIINHNYSAEKRGDEVEVEGSYDINVWLSYNKNTKTDVTTQTVTYKDTVPLSMRDVNVLSGDMDVIARATRQPNTLEATISEDGEKIEVQIEREFAVECIGETKVAVAVTGKGMMEEIVKEEEAKDDQFEQINPEFIQKK